ncbi:PrgI family protein [Candidatus Peregrinibacteria bacterium]|nr:MAG: PrgI family protein [Candidatus Peregrinibacteria bacterium]
MQYKIPQNVQIEDKIVGPLTLRQLIYAGIGGGLTYALYSYFGSRYYMGLWVILPLSTAILTLLSIFFHPNGITFGKWCMLTVEYFLMPNKRTFVMGAGDTYAATLFAQKEKKVQTKTEDSGKSERDHERLQKIGEISKLLDSYGKPQTS